VEQTFENIPDASEVEANHPDLLLFHQDRNRTAFCCLLFPQDCGETMFFVRHLDAKPKFLSDRDLLLLEEHERTVDMREVMEAKVEKLRKTVESRLSLKVRTPVPQARLTQRMFPIRHLSAVLFHCRDLKNHYLAQNSFRPDRNGLRRSVGSVSQLTSCWVDLDFYKLKDGAVCSQLADDASAVEAIHAVCLTLYQRGHPLLPTLIVRSGRGIYVKWIFNHFLPPTAHPRWSAVQDKLTEAFKILGSDPSVKDAARVLRIVGSINAKSNSHVRVIYRGSTVSFDDLANTVLPSERLSFSDRQAVKTLTEQYQRDIDKRRALGQRRKRLVRPWAGTQWSTLVANELPKIIDILGPGDPMRGRMEGLTFVVMNFRLMAGMVHNKEDFEQQVRTLGTHMHADVEKLLGQVISCWVRHAAGKTPYRLNKTKIRARLAIDVATHPEVFAAFPWLLDRKLVPQPAGIKRPSRNRRELGEQARAFETRGLSLKEIGIKLSVSPKTVKRLILEAAVHQQNME
jgi:hypothetical protein